LELLLLFVGVTLVVVVLTIVTVFTGLLLLLVLLLAALLAALLYTELEIDATLKPRKSSIDGTLVYVVDQDTRPKVL